MHSFRRLNVTWRQQAGATPAEAQKAAGHGSLDMTFLYTQTEDAREREHVGKIIERLGIAAPNSGPSPDKLQQMQVSGGVQ